MIDSNDRYAATRMYQQRNEDNSHNNNAARRKFRQQHEAYQEHVVSKLPEKSFTRQENKLLNIDMSLFAHKNPNETQK